MSDTPSLNFYRKWLHDVGGIEQEAGEALMARIAELESALASERAKTAALTSEMQAYHDRGLIFTATELFKRDSANFDRGYAEHAAEIREAQK